MAKIIKLKVRDMSLEGDRVGDEVVRVWLERCYNKKFATYLNKKGQCYRVIVHIPDEE